jgi:transposase InsO family protein
MGGGDSADVGALRRLRAEVAELRRANEIELIGPYSTGQNWSGLREVERETAEWVRWYNHERIHSSIDYMTPIEREVMYGDTIAQRGEVA